jgi:hypothetical protein
MTGIYWRLLACFTLIFLVSALRAQNDDAPAARAAPLAPTFATSAGTPLSRPIPIALPVEGLAGGSLSQGTMGLRQIFRAAGIIFSGRVTFVEPAENRATLSAGQSASTAVTFYVEDALRGTATGQSLTIHEWSGLWRGREHYRVGERVFLFLYSPSKLGLTSPVAGGMGRFAIDPQGNIAMNAKNIPALAADPVIGGRKVVPYTAFIRAVQRAGGVE